MRALIVLLLMCGVAQAEGLSLIGMCNPTWNCRATIQGWRDRPIVVGWLENSFGNRCSCADKLLKLRRKKTIRVHLANSPCLRNRRCDMHDIFYGHTVTTANHAMMTPGSDVRRRFAKVISRFAARLEKSKGRVSCYVSACLECDLNETSRNLMARRLRSRLPDCHVVDNPLKDACLPRTICEKHGPDVPRYQPCIYDLDGTEVKSFTELKKVADKTKHCTLRFAWSHWMNCVRENQSFVMPLARRCEVNRTTTQSWGDIAWNFLSARS